MFTLKQYTLVMRAVARLKRDQERNRKRASGDQTIKRLNAEIEELVLIDQIVQDAARAAREDEIRERMHVKQESTDQLPLFQEVTREEGQEDQKDKSVRQSDEGEDLLPPFNGQSNWSDDD